MDKSELRRIRNEIVFYIGLTVIALIIGGAIIGGVYTVIGQFTHEGLHLFATGLVFAVFGAYLLGLRVAKSHVAGFQKGVDLKLSARDRERQAARPATIPIPAPSPAARFDDLLPKMGQAVIVTRTDDSRSSIDM